MQITITGKRILIQSDTYAKRFNLSDVVVGEKEFDEPIQLIFPTETIKLPTEPVIFLNATPLGEKTYNDLEEVKDVDVRDFLSFYLNDLDLFFLASNNPITLQQNVNNFSVAAKKLVEFIVIESTNTATTTINIGTTNGGNDILENVEIENGVALLPVAYYPQTAKNIYVTGLNTNYTLKIYKR